MLISGSTHKQTWRPETLPSKHGSEYLQTHEGVSSLWEDPLGVHGLKRPSPLSPAPEFL